jgi:hypothetical protein
MSVIRKEQTNITGGGGAKYEAPMAAQYDFWLVTHGLGTLSPVVTCWDEFDRILTPWHIEVIDPTSLRVWFWNRYRDSSQLSTPVGRVAVI